MKQQNRNWLTTGQAAQLCAVTPATVLSWIRKGRLDGIRTAGGHYRIKRENLAPLMTVEGSGASTKPKEGPPAVAPLRCWEYLSDGNGPREVCEGCVAYRTRTSWCFLLARPESGASELGHACPNTCSECAYYRRIFSLPTRVLVVSSDQRLIDRVRVQESNNLAFRFANSVYEASAIAQIQLPAVAIIDGDGFPVTEDGLVQSLAHDPRLPGLKIIIADSKETGRVERTIRLSNVVVHVIGRQFSVDSVTAVIEKYPVESVGFEELTNAGLSPEGDAAMIEQKHGALMESEVNDDGFLNTMASWDREAAEQLAKEHDIGPLTDDHWKVIDYVQDYYATYGRGPEVVKVHRETGLTTSDICTLFPCGLVKGAYRLAGLPRPPGCV